MIVPVLYYGTMGPFRFCSEECRDSHISRTIGAEPRRDTQEVEEPAECETCNCRLWESGEKDWYIPIPQDTRDSQAAVIRQVRGGKFGPYRLLYGMDLEEMMGGLYMHTTDGVTKTLRQRLLEITDVADARPARIEGLRLKETT